MYRGASEKHRNIRGSPRSKSQHIFSMSIVSSMTLKTLRAGRIGGVLHYYTIIK